MITKFISSKEWSHVSHYCSPPGEVGGKTYTSNGRDRAIGILKGEIDSSYIMTMFAWVSTTDPHLWAQYDMGKVKIDGAFHQALCDLIMSYPVGDKYES